MAHPDPEQVNFIFEHIGKILTALTVVILALVKFITNNKNAGLAKDVLTEKPVSHAELLRCQMEVNATVNANFEKLRSDFMQEVRLIHKRINELHD